MRPPRRLNGPRRIPRLPDIPLLGDLFDLARPTQFAIVFAYWLYMSAAGLFAGMPVVASLMLSLIFLGITLGLAALNQWLRDRMDEDIFSRSIIAIVGGLSILFGGLIVFLPLIVFLVLGLQLLFSIPVWLMRM